MFLNLQTDYIMGKKQTGQEKTVKSQAELAEFLRRQISVSTEQKSDGEKENMRARIEAKLKAGKKLTAEEVRFLQETDPVMYLQYQRIRAMADAMAEQLKHAKTKQQANDVITSAIGGVSDKDPCREYVIAAMNEVAKEFKKNPAYSRLPDKDSDLKKKKPENARNEFKYGESEEEFDPMNWSPLQEVIDAMPTFNAPA